MSRCVALRRTLTGCAAFLLAALLLEASKTYAQQETALPADRCQVVMELPAGTQVAVDGRDYGAQTEFNFDDLAPGQVHSSKVTLTFRSGAQLERTVLVQGGRRIRLAELDPQEKQAEMVLQQGHDGGVGSVTYSPDGRTLVSTGGDDIKLWDAADGRLLRTIDGGGHSAIYSPDGRTLATHFDKSIKLWNANSGRLLRTLEGARGPVVYNPDGRTLVSLSDDWAEIKYWDAADGRLLKLLEAKKTEDDSGIVSMIYSRDGRRLATASSMGAITVWDTASDRSLWSGEPQLLDACKPEWSLAFSADGRTIASESNDGAVKLWDVTDGKLLRKLEGHEEPVNNLAYSPDGRTLVSTGGDDIKLWDAADGRLLRTQAAHTSGVEGVAYSPDGRTIASASNDKTIKFWNATDGRLLRTIEGNDNGFESFVIGRDGALLSRSEHDVFILAFCPKGRVLALAADNMTIELWDVAEGRFLRRLEGHTDYIQCVAFSPDGRTIVSVSLDKTIRFWDVTDGRLLRTLKGVESTLSPDGRTFATLSSDKSIKLWKATDGRLLWTVPAHKTHDLWIHAITFSFDSRTLASAGADGRVKLWNAADGELLRTLEGHRGRVFSTAYSPDGRTIASTSEDKTIKLWDTTNGQLLRTLDGHERTVYGVAFSPDGRTLASISTFDTIKLWNATDGELLQTLNGEFLRMALSPDRCALATLNNDGMIELWDLVGGELLQTIQREDGPFNSMSFTADGRTLVTSGINGLRLFDLFTGKQLCQLHSFANGDWLVTTPEGLFDGNEGGQQRVFYRVGAGLQIAPVAYFRQEYYRAGLLARLMNGERPLPTSHAQGNMPPKIVFDTPTDRSVVDVAETTLRFTLNNAGGGLGPVQARRNGAPIELDEPIASSDQAVTYEVKVQLEPGENRIFITARAADRGSLESSQSISIFCKKDLVRADLYVLALGVSDYELKELKLDFAADDARQITRVFTERAGKLYGKIHNYPLCDAEATKEKLKDACAEIAKKAKPQDTLLVFMAGHGKEIGGQFFFLPVNLTRTSEIDVIRDGIDTDILFDDYLRGLQVGKRILVIDACHAGAAIQSRTRDSYTMQDMVARLAHDKGIYTLAGASEDETAEERPELKHGALTYTLLAALGEIDFGPLKNQKILSDTPVVTVTDWFGFATKHLPILAPDQKPEQQISGQNFPLLPVTP